MKFYTCSRGGGRASAVPGGGQVNQSPSLCHGRMGWTVPSHYFRYHLLVLPAPPRPPPHYNFCFMIQWLLAGTRGRSSKRPRPGCAPLSSVTYPFSCSCITILVIAVCSWKVERMELLQRHLERVRLGLPAPPGCRHISRLLDQDSEDAPSFHVFSTLFACLSLFLLFIVPSQLLFFPFN